MPITLEGDTTNTLTYWVKGSGEVRNAQFANDAYSSYSPYTIVDSKEWQKVEHIFVRHHIPKPNDDSCFNVQIF